MIVSGIPFENSFDTPTKTPFKRKKHVNLLSTKEFRRNLGISQGFFPSKIWCLPRHSAIELGRRIQIQTWRARPRKKLTTASSELKKIVHMAQF